MAYQPSPNLGQATSANSLPVVLASDQDTLDVSVTNASIQISDGGNSITVDGAVDINQPSGASFRVQISDGTSDVPIDAAHSDAETNTENHIDVGAKGLFFNGNTWDRVRGDVSNGMLVNLGTNNDVTVSGTVTANAGTGTMNVSVQNASIPITDNGGSLTVDGTVAATQSGTWNITNISGTVSLPTGAATSANQTTEITALQLLDNVVNTAGSAAVTSLYQVGGTDGTNARILSTNASGHLNIADGGNSITVDGTVAATQSGTWNITNITGTVSLPTGAATETTLSSLNTKVPANLTVSATRLLVDGSGVTQPISGTVTVQDGGNSITVDGTVAATQSGTWNVGLNAGSNAIGSITNTSFAATQATAANLNATVVGTGTFAVQAAQSGNYTVRNQDGAGNNLASSTTTPAGTEQALIVRNIPSGTQAVSGTVAATQSGTWILGANSGVDIGDVTINNAGGASAVNIQDGGNTITVDGTVTVTDGLNIEGDVANDSVDSGNPVKIGFRAVSALPAAVATNDRVNGTADLYGRQLVTNIDDGMQVWKGANYTTTQTGTDIWTPSSGTRIGVTYLAISSYATTAARVILWFGASGDTQYNAGTDQLVWAGSFAPSTNAKPGAIVSLPFGIFAVTADHRLKITTDAAISLDITVYGYEH